MMLNAIGKLRGMLFFIFPTSRVFSLSLVHHCAPTKRAKYYHVRKKEDILSKFVSRGQEVYSHPPPATVGHWKKKGNESRAKRPDIKAEVSKNIGVNGSVSKNSLRRWHTSHRNPTFHMAVI